MNQYKKLSLQNIVLIAMFSAVLAILSQISLPLPNGMYITFQTFGIVIIGTVLGAKSGALAVIVYLLIGFTGFPVFAGFKGGAGVLFGPTGGYLIGFVIMAFIVGMGKGRNIVFGFILCGTGLFICHAFGFMGYHIVTSTYLPTAAILFGKDLVMACIGLFIGRDLLRRLSSIFPQMLDTQNEI